MKKGHYCASYCNKLHRLEDGKPIKHSCFVLPTEALHAEREGNTLRAQEVMQGWKKKRPHHGVGT